AARRGGGGGGGGVGEGRRGLHGRPSPRGTDTADVGDAQLLKYQVSVWAMCGLSLTALFQRRSGTLPIVFLITRTPCDAGEFETTGISHSSSSAIFQTSLARRVRSWSGTENERRDVAISSRIRAGGSLPCRPALEYQVP